jgi:hypothetical protein
MDKNKREIADKEMRQKYAAGGAAKVRKGEATSSGKQIKTPQKPKK